MNGFEYLKMAALKTQKDGTHWFRYMGKLIKYTGMRLTDLEIKQALQSEQLSDFKKVTLKDGVTEGTYTHEYLIGLEKPHWQPFWSVNYKDLFKRWKQQKAAGQKLTWPYEDKYPEEARVTRFKHWFNGEELSSFDFLLKAARDTAKNGEQWFKYLSQVIKENDILLEDWAIWNFYYTAYGDGIPPSFHKVTLKDAVTDGTCIHEYISCCHKPGWQPFWKTNLFNIIRG